MDQMQQAARHRAARIRKYTSETDPTWAVGHSPMPYEVLVQAYGDYAPRAVRLLVLVERTRQLLGWAA